MASSSHPHVAEIDLAGTTMGGSFASTGNSGGWTKCEQRRGCIGGL